MRSRYCKAVEEVVKTGRSIGSKNFAVKTEKFTLNSSINLKPAEI